MVRGAIWALIRLSCRTRGIRYQQQPSFWVPCCVGVCYKVSLLGWKTSELGGKNGLSPISVPHFPSCQLEKYLWWASERGPDPSFLSPGISPSFLFFSCTLCPPFPPLLVINTSLSLSPLPLSPSGFNCPSFRNLYMCLRFLLRCSYIMPFVSEWVVTSQVREIPSVGARETQPDLGMT